MRTTRMDIKKIMKALAGAFLVASVFFVVIPYSLIKLGRIIGINPHPTIAGMITGSVLITFGLIIFFLCFSFFIKKGKGTPPPYVPTKKLVKDKI
ncbi:MAG: hypothetical protein ACQEP1_01565 [Nanobdellota archaeon]